MQAVLAHEPPDGWTGLLDADPAADACHCPFWIATLARHRPGTQPLWLTVHADGRLVGGLAALGTAGPWGRLDSGPDGTAGGPVVRADLDPAAAAQVARTLLQALTAARGGPLRGCGVALNPGHEARWRDLVLADRRFRRLPVPAAVLDLGGGAEAVAARFRKSKRNERNRGLRRGCEVAVTAADADLAAWHRLHHAACRRWGTAPLPLDLLRDLLQRAPAADGGSAFFTCVRCEGRVVGGHLNLHRGDGVTAWSGVTDPAVARTHFPSTLAVWGDVEEACRRGARWLDLGSSGGIASLEEFKRTLGAETRERGWYLAESLPRRLLRSVADGRRGAARGRWHDPGQRA
ncbi:MAG: GNAT family N-acetyltransferase [Candidatus Krumholzibacteriia bacterium]